MKTSLMRLIDDLTMKTPNGFDQQRLEHPVSPRIPTAVAPPSFPYHPVSPIPIEGHPEGLWTKEQVPGTGKESTEGGRSQVTIDVLPDVALLKIFDLYLDDPLIDAWYTLIHVCQNWRNLVFGSPRRLNLRLKCTARTPVRESLNVWPRLPIVIKVYGRSKRGMDNVIAALEHDDRICQLVLFDIPTPQLKEIFAAMQQPFPALTHLEIQPEDITWLDDPASFLGGSVPSLQTLILGCIPFLGLPKLLLSATRLVRLELWSIPHTGYISPEAMATCLSVLTRLECLHIEFEYPQCFPYRNSRCPPPQTRTLLPILTKLRFKGLDRYLEDFVARIDAPLLDKLGITFFHELQIDTLQLTEFISRTPKFKAPDKAQVAFNYSQFLVTFPQASDGTLDLAILCDDLDWQLSTLAQFFSSPFPRTFIPAVEHLLIFEAGFCDFRDHNENYLWLDVLRPFTALKHLIISQKFTPSIAPALQELVGERVTEVLPALKTLFLVPPLPTGPVREALRQFVAARQFVGHPITVSRWEGTRFE